ncbi:MAG: VWA domain-containing protein [Candidatus Aminicenantes bacterium]|nr:MAG: VWA domain-containing protein [Candidatus Aminicenantes bacterium]
MAKIILGKKKSLSMFLFLVFILSILSDGNSSLSCTQEKKKQEIAYDVAVTAISISVSVQNRKGRHITDLTEEDFSVYENNKRKEITYFSHNFEAPLSLTVLLDVSGSMALQDKLSESKEALDYLMNHLLADRDEVSLLIFADGDVEVASSFSRDKTDFLSVLERTEAYGQTALNDAVGVSPDFANRGNNEKRALLLITDGIENDSEYSPEQAIEVARRVDIPIYTIGYKIPLDEQFLKKYKRSKGLTVSGIAESLERFSEATGGKAFFVNKTLDLKNALRLIKQELSHQYILGYTSYTDPNNEYRKIKVSTKKKSYMVRTREGYYSGEKKDS